MLQEEPAPSRKEALATLNGRSRVPLQSKIITECYLTEQAAVLDK